MVGHDPKCGNIYYTCSNVCEVTSGLLTPQEAGTIGQRLSFSRQLNSVYRHVFSLISQALQNTENVAIVMYCFFVY